MSRLNILIFHIIVIHCFVPCELIDCDNYKQCANETISSTVECNGARSCFLSTMESAGVSCYADSSRLDCAKIEITSTNAENNLMISGYSAAMNCNTIVGYENVYCWGTNACSGSKVVFNSTTAYLYIGALYSFNSGFLTSQSSTISSWTWTSKV